MLLSPGHSLPSRQPTPSVQVGSRSRPGSTPFGTIPALQPRLELVPTPEPNPCNAITSCMPCDAAISESLLHVWAASCPRQLISGAALTQSGQFEVPRIRLLRIFNFRSVASLEWCPSAGINCLIGPGDAGKSSILDAIDLCVGARRNVQFCDADFHSLDTATPIMIEATLGDLPDGLRSMEAYGQFLRGWDPALGEPADEPGAGLETVLTLRISVAADLEPAWSLVSDRATAQGLSRNLAWADRVRLAPMRIGGSATANLSWRRGSVLDRLSDERADATAALVKAARDAREAFGTQAEGQLSGTLAIVERVAGALGVPLDGGAHAYLDAASVSFSGGTVSLHDGRGVPLTGLGTGSSRLLVAGLQREAAPRAGMVLVDELEYGLEPHRIIGFLGSLGAKERIPPLQVFATTHSPVAVRELSAAQLHVVRRGRDGHVVLPASSHADQVQGTMRTHPEAFLGRKVVVCEGASEVGLLRGLDLYLTRTTKWIPLAAKGVMLSDAGGADKLYARVGAFVALGYDTLAFRDDDVQPTPDMERTFLEGGGKLVKWRSGRALEDELFTCLPDVAVAALVERAIEIHGQQVIDAHIGSASNGSMGLRDPAALLNPAGRAVLAKASKGKKAGWFKSVTWMEDAAADIIGPHIATADKDFQAILAELIAWSN